MSLTSTSQATRPQRRAITTASLLPLVIGGFAGLGLWEVFANVLVIWLSGAQLSPPSLVQALAARWLGLELAFPTATMIHYATGFLFYPLGYLILTRLVASFGLLVDGIVWGVLTFILALGILAPLAGFPLFLHTQGPWLAIISLVGHVTYALLAAYVFETLDSRRGT